MNLVCFRHPKYNGTNTPVLSCKTCCTMFLAALKNKQVDMDSIKKVDRQGQVERVQTARLSNVQKS